MIKVMAFDRFYVEDYRSGESDKISHFFFFFSPEKHKAAIDRQHGWSTLVVGYTFRRQDVSKDY